MHGSIIFYIDTDTSWSKEIGLQLSPIPTNTTFLSKYIKDFPKVYTAFPLYLLCPGAGIKRRPLSAAYINVNTCIKVSAIIMITCIKDDGVLCCIL